VLILSGSPIIGSFDYRARVDFVRIPGVIKLHNGKYTSLGLHIDLEQTLAMRSSIIHHTAKIFEPDLFLVDKEPLGLSGEVLQTLQYLRQRGTVTVLGLRDVMDEPTMLRREWQRKRALPALQDLYDEIWAYGLEQLGEPLSGLTVPSSVQEKMIYTGYLRRDPPKARMLPSVEMKEPYLLVTAGGGGDGEEMIDWVLRAYEHDSSLPFSALLVLGPFMSPARQRAFQRRADCLSHVRTLEFDNHIELLIQRAVGVVAMGGYNTFCEILSLNKRALLVPRTRPRKEQLIRARRAQQLGVAKMLVGSGDRDWRVMARALHDLPSQPRPSEVVIPGILNGLTTIGDRVESWITNRREPRVKLTSNVPIRAPQ
jgi:predicted glycosyltransferase